MFLRIVTALSSAAALAVSVVAQGDPEVVTKIIDEGKARNQTRSHLEYLCEQIGHRLTTSSSLERGSNWAMEMFRSWGCQNVHLEKWGEWPVGFDRAKDGHLGRMTAPYARDFQFTTPSWTPGTKGLQKGRAVMAPANMEEFNKNRGSYKGAWLMMLPAQGGGGGRGQGGGNNANAQQSPEAKAREELMAALQKAGIKGTVTGARNELVITSGNYNIKPDALPTLTRITVRKSDYEAVTKALQEGKRVDLEFDIRQQFRKGPIANNNIIAEIPGTEKPDEVVIVSGHFDTWDGPGSQGACDNGTGSSVVLEAARILCTVGAKPKRTIRFILWTGEEQGLHGSREYVKAHAAEMDKISACLVDDGGTNYWGGFVGLESQQPLFQKSMDVLMEAFPTLPMKWQNTTNGRMPRGGGSDHASFNSVGVPGYFTMETGVADYTYIHHTQHDKLTAAVNAYLVQSSTAAAVTAYNLACADTMVPREPKTGN